ncbi:hypothetical protein ACHWQZ_G000441 [Mnemiopsis leidyi]
MAYWTPGVDVFIGVLLLALSLLALTLNPVVIFYNIRQKRSLSTILFCAIAATDILVGLTGLYPSYNFITHHHKRCGANPLCKHQETQKHSRIKTTQTLFLMLGLGGSSLATVSLAVVRYIKIKFPFNQIRRLYIYLYAAVLNLYMIALFSYILSQKTMIWVVPGQALFLTIQTGGDMLYSLVAVPFYLNYLLSILASLLTVLTLVKSRDLSEIQRQRLAGSRKIILMNIGVTGLSFLMIVQEVDVQTAAIGQANQLLMLVAWNLYPRVLAVANPVVFVVMTWDKFRGRWWEKRRISVASVNVSGNGGNEAVQKQMEVVLSAFKARRSASEVQENPAKDTT